MEFTTTQNPPTGRGSPERRGVSAQMPITAAKEDVTVMRLVEREAATQGKEIIPSGNRSKVLCLLPDHEEKTPSFTVYPDGRWWCFGCLRGGDVVELARLLWGHEDTGRGAAEAAAMLLLEFGHEIPQRPPSYFARQARQKPVRDRIREGRVEHVAALVFRLIWMPWLKRLPDDVREDAKETAWRDSLWMADRLYAGRRSA